MEKLVKVTVERYYKVMGETEDDIQRVVDGYTPRIGNAVMRGIKDTYNERCIVPSTNGAVVSTSFVDNPEKKHTVICTDTMN